MRVPFDQRQGLYWDFRRWLVRQMPRGLYQRALVILIAPIVLLQLLIGALILDRYWNDVSKALGRSLSREIGLLVDQYNTSDKSEAALKRIEAMARDRLKLDMNVLRGSKLPEQVNPTFFGFFDKKMHRYLTRETGRAFWVDSDAANDKVEIQVEVDPGLIFQIKADSERALAASAPFVLSMLVGATVLATATAIVFLGRQIRPILELAQAAKDFGLGRETKDFRPRGAAEIREAGLAFMDMRRRIARHVEQRTAMLAGVSHDLRTILTRFKLELAFLGKNPKVEPLKQDVEEMQHMLEDYMAFVRGDGGEQVGDVQVADAVRSTIENVVRHSPSVRGKVAMGKLPSQRVRVKPNAFGRLLANLIGNAARYGTHAEVSGEIKDDRLWIYVDDDGPGIPADKREDAFRPFMRLDHARNLDETGTGLGLAIALDIAHAHGGEIILEDSALGGLRAAVKLPV